MSFFIIVFIVHTIINAYIFYRGWRAFPKSPYVKVLYSAIFVIFYGSFAVMMLGRNHFPLELQKIFYSLGTTWLAIMLYITLYFVITDLILLANKYIKFIPKTITSKTYRRIQVFSGYALVFAVLLIGNQKYNNPTIVQQDIVINKSGHNLKQLKAVAVSDIHLGINIDKGKLKKYVDIINEQNPDIILIAGDLIDNNLRPLWEEKMYEELNNLKAPLGTYMCLGNHEYLSGLNESLEFIKHTNITLLKDSAAHINNSFWIIGRDDKHNPERLQLNQITDSIKATNDYNNQPIILLDHQPYNLEQAEQSNIDLQFSGHTHHGQLWPLNLIVNKIYEVGHGYKQKGNTNIYVSSGLALWGPEFRVGTQSEVVVFNIRLN
ncbi:putative MPP superfamily phosphohydrolase [Dysgonomonadaceae bacterium PH5-43]|nr:putative MPP superfamily phosphohydrolase [Dysgonomonadaceae bacterium PH5-43]